MNLDGRRILVTGGAGFIGSHVVDRLLANPAVGGVVVLDNLANGRRENLERLGLDPRLALVTGDLLEPATAREALRDAQVVFHLACLGVRHSLHDPAANHRVNAEGTLLLLEEARRAGVDRFVHVSSSEVFGTAQTVPMDERHPTWPETVYGAAKLAGEAYARAAHRTHGLPTVVVRPFNTYGPRSHFEGDCGEVIPRTIVRVLCGLAPLVFGDGTQTRDFLHVRDTARALVDIAGCDDVVGHTLNVGYGRECSILELCRTIARMAGRRDLVPTHTAPRPGDVRRLWVDNAAVRKAIGFEPTVGLDEGLEETVGWFRDRPESPQEMLVRMTDRNWEPARR